MVHQFSRLCRFVIGLQDKLAFHKLHARQLSRNHSNDAAVKRLQAKLSLQLSETCMLKQQIFNQRREHNRSLQNFQQEAKEQRDQLQDMFMQRMEEMMGAFKTKAVALQADSKQLKEDNLKLRGLVDKGNKRLKKKKRKTEQAQRLLAVALQSNENSAPTCPQSQKRSHNPSLFGVGAGNTSSVDVEGAELRTSSSKENVASS